MEEDDQGEFAVRKLSVICAEESRIVQQFHYSSWPDHGVPTATRPLLDMIALMREYQPQHDPPIVIHCRCVFFCLLLLHVLRSLYTRRFTLHSM